MSMDDGASPDHRQRSSRASQGPWRSARDANPFGVREVLAVAQHDLFGTKDVQDVITASYVWLADQMGHISLGFLPTLALACGWHAAWSWLVGPDAAGDLASAHPLGFVLGLVTVVGVVLGVWGYKEAADLADSRRKAGGVFPLDAVNLRQNVYTALFYFGFGSTLAASAFLGLGWLLGALVLEVVPALAIALWWLRRKIAFQQAGLPYLYRLASFPSHLDPAEVDAVLSVARAPRESGDTAHLIVVGPLGAGKTSLAVGIGTEFAFQLGLGRYLSLTKLLQLTRTTTRDIEPERKGEPEYTDGRVLWPWRDAELLIVDDVDIGVGRDACWPPVAAEFLVCDLRWLKRRRSVWVLGENEPLDAWRHVLAGALGLEHPTSIAIVRLQASSTPPTSDRVGEAPAKKR